MGCHYEAGHFDVVWASPGCTQYSRARTTAKTPRNFERADGLAKRCLELIRQLQPRVWFLGNPDSGFLNTRHFMIGLPYVRVDYCMYGAPYMKRTRVCTNVQNWTPKLCDRSHLVDGKHTRTTQRGGRGKWSSEDRFTRDELHRLPWALCDEVCVVVQSE